MWRDNAPFPTTTVIGFDDAAGVHHAVRRCARPYTGVLDDVYRRCVDRDAFGIPESASASIGTVSADGDTVDARWETSEDGVTWNLDFELTYVRER